MREFQRAININKVNGCIFESNSTKYWLVCVCGSLCVSVLLYIFLEFLNFYLPILILLLLADAYIIKLFDRSVDLAQFNTSTPLYPICRAWMRNNPSVREPAASPSSPHSMVDDEVREYICVDALVFYCVKHIIHNCIQVLGDFASYSSLSLLCFLSH